MCNKRIDHETWNFLLNKLYFQTLKPCQFQLKSGTFIGQKRTYFDFEKKHFLRLSTILNSETNVREF